MKVFWVALFVIALSGIAQAVSVEEIGRLAELKTSDTLILQLIEQNGLDQPLTTKDVIYLREHGASESVIRYLLTLSKPEETSQAVAQKSPEAVSDRYRSYTSTAKNGKTVRVLTNLDENGKRMGPMPPPEPEPAPVPEQIAYAEPPAAQEIYVTVRDERDSNRDYEPDYYEEPSGIPLYNTGYYPYYSPGYFPYLNPNMGHNMHHNQNFPHWRFNAAVRPVRSQNPQPSRPPMRVPPASAGMRRR